MNAKGLRVGNLIHANTPVMTVTAISKDYIDAYMPDSEADDFRFDIDSVEGIPISHIVLEKCGGVKSDGAGNNIWYMLGDNAVSLRKDGIYYYSDAEIPVQYVHELQNAYWVINQFKQELEINL